MTGASTHWAAAYIGRPWDPAEDHCWAFCRLVWRERFGIEVPQMPIHAEDLRAAVTAFGQASERNRWQPVSTPAEGDGVLMARGQRACHVGLWLDLGGVLHAIAPVSVFTPAGRLRDLGYRVAGYYRRAAA